MRNRKAICILGGMGPEASAYLYQLLITQAAKDFGAVNNDDFPEIILHSVPVPDFISSDRNKSQALSMLKKRVKLLQTMDISCIAIACNTAHVLFNDLQKVSEKPFLSMIEEVVEVVNTKGIKKIGIMGTPSTIKSKLYQSKLGEYGITPVTPGKDKLMQLEEVIRHIIANTVTEKDYIVLVDIANDLHRKGAEGIILGCTELPLIFPQQYSLPIFNSLEILAKALLQKYYE